MSTSPDEVVVRLYIEVGDDRVATGVAERAIAALSLGEPRQHSTQRYWKIAAYFEVLLVYPYPNDTELSTLASRIAAGFELDNSDPDERSALWKQGAGEAFDPTVRWATLERVAGDRAD